VPFDVRIGSAPEEVVLPKVLKLRVRVAVLVSLLDLCLEEEHLGGIVQRVSLNDLAIILGGFPIQPRNDQAV